MSAVRQRDGWSRRAGGSAFDPVASKLRRPPIRPGTVRRWSLTERLVRDHSRPIVSVVAPAGYGKTTLLSQWAERNGQAFAWVSVDEADNDPKVLLSYVAEALDAVEPIDERVFDTLASPVSSVPGSVVPRLGKAFSLMTSPVVLVLDDVHVLDLSECGPRCQCWPMRHPQRVFGRSGLASGRLAGVTDGPGHGMDPARRSMSRTRSSHLLAGHQASDRRAPRHAPRHGKSIGRTR